MGFNFTFIIFKGIEKWSEPDRYLNKMEHFLERKGTRNLKISKWTLLLIIF